MSSFGPLLSKFGWTVNRLKRMSVREMGYRAKQGLRTRLEQHGFGTAKYVPAPLLEREGGTWLQNSVPIDRARYVAAADQILSGRFSIFANEIQLGFPPHWNRDSETGVEAPKTFGKLINYRDRTLVGNIKTLWEPGRHLELVTLAQAYALTKEQRFADGCNRLIESWLTDCPYPVGVHWTSSLELAIRLLNWSAAWNLLGSADGIRCRPEWLQSIYQHCHFIAGYLSKYSSANNHLLGEWMGLFVASLTWPYWNESQTWAKRSHEAIESEALAQNCPDGVNREQAVYYHHEVADMMLICSLVGRANGVEFSSAYWDRLESMMDFIVAVQDVKGNVPMIGDADDALMLRLHQDPDWTPYRSLLACCAVIFKRPDFKSAAKLFDEKAVWLLGESGLAEWEALSASLPAPRRRVFPEGGYCTLGSRLGTSEELRIVADSGPLGYLSIAAHGHADALALTLSACGEELLIDPGTYAYHTERDWRDWFRSTAAHNTICVDATDQSVIGGSFMWLKHASATLENVDVGVERDMWRASHDGYRRLADPVLHRREIAVFHAVDEVHIIDTLECSAVHTATFNWHVAESAEVHLEDYVVVVRRARVTLKMSMEPPSRPSLMYGSTDPKGGWVSRRFGEKRPTTQITWTSPLKGSTQWKTVLKLERTHSES